MALLTLALYKAYEYLKSSLGAKGIHLVQVCVEDQAQYYVFVVVFCAVRLGYLFITDTFAANVLNAAGSPAILCILGSRLLVNLKEAGEKGANRGVTDELTTISDMQFS
ncbi:uncharacterized protein FOMMEDRAFT_157953 [Fomitiporia mediterranea MF3/22]|uniref:uncharacterized protein n=1 Tax=Fomitiporia mediterranea (strain MF3/22) TaxID=694068 RepID=UPI0004409857|nr:uncharacterized protein FOMMEDRAFT_157953 [Fomitiporia mediterranea MF3/22]EJD00845.1 hypothetical protein FOMMEDRAFT_157953 [Fomitiporia mediterranea MF3/22]